VDGARDVRAGGWMGGARVRNPDARGAHDGHAERRSRLGHHESVREKFRDLGAGGGIRRAPLPALHPVPARIGGEPLGRLDRRPRSGGGVHPGGIASGRAGQRPHAPGGRRVGPVAGARPAVLRRRAIHPHPDRGRDGCPALSGSRRDRARAGHGEVRVGWRGMAADRRRVYARFEHARVRGRQEGTGSMPGTASRSGVIADPARRA
jgi:hypothetical protein